MPKGGRTDAPPPGAASPDVRPNLAALVSLAHTLCEAGRVHEAEELCRLVLREQPGMAVAQAALGRALYEAGKLDAAEVWLELTARQNPGCFAAHRWLAEVLIQKGTPDRAYAVLAQAAVLAPDNPRVQQLLARLPFPHEGGSAPPPEMSSGASLEELAAQVEAPVPRRPRTQEYPATAFDEAPPPRPSEPRIPPSSPVSRTQSVPVPTIQPHGARSWLQPSTSMLIVGGALVVAMILLVWAASGPRLPRGEAAGRGPPDTQIRATLEQAIATSGLGELVAATQAATGHLAAPDVASAESFAFALLSSEYGVTPPQESRALAAATSGDERLASERAAARVLFALGDGDPARAAHEADGARETPWLAFAEAKVRRLAGLAAPEDGKPAESNPVGAALVLRAQTLVDEGDPGRAAQLMIRLLALAPDQTRARLTLAEARAALGVAEPDDDARLLRQTCAVEGTRSPVVEGGCALAMGEDMRRRGERAGARERALRAAALAPPDARVLAETAQLLVNLGETKQAAALVTRAGAFAAPSYPPLAWATLGVRINRGEEVDPDRAPIPSGPESRLMAARAALAHGGAAGVQRALRNMSTAQMSFDPDLGWFATLPRIRRPRAGVKLADKYASEHQRPGPVGAYVLGLLARWGHRRHLAMRWLAQAREGHGDACTAADLYVATLEDLGDPTPRSAIPPDCQRKEH